MMEEAVQVQSSEYAYNHSALCTLHSAFRWCGSLAVAIFLMALLMILLGWATFVENKYGANVAQYAIYRSWWFDVLLTLFGLNVLCAMLARLPWRWRHIPFVVAHLGILILLIGCWVTSRYGLEAQLTVYEGELGRFAQRVSGDEINLEIIDFHNPRCDSHGAIAGRSDELEHERMAREQLDVLRDRSKIKPPGVELQPDLDTLANTYRERVSVTLGPMNWRDQAVWPVSWLLKLAKRSQGTVYDQDGIRVELLDYLADSRMKPADQLMLRIQKIGVQTTDVGLEDEATNTNPETRSLKPEVWETRELPLGLVSEDSRGQDPYLTSLPEERITYRLTKSNAETMAFLELPQEQALGTWGSVVIRVGGSQYVIAVDDLIKRQAQFGKKLNDTLFAKQQAEIDATGLRIQQLAPDEGTDIETIKTQLAEKESEIARLDKELAEFNAQIRMAIGETGLSFEMTQFRTDAMLMILNVYREDDTRYIIALSGDYPLSSTVPDALGMQIMHLFDPDVIINEQPDQASSMAFNRAMKPRLDLLQGRDQKLYYRFWDGWKYSRSGEMPTDQTVLPLQGHDGSVLNIAVNKYEPQDYPGLKLVAEPFKNPSANKMGTVPCVKLRVCVDGVGDETYWVQKTPFLIPATQLREHQAGYVSGQNRTVAVTFPMAWLDLGFSLFLHKFERKLEPGISMPSHFSSLVSVYPIDDTNADTTGREPLHDYVLIRMNQPGMFADQVTGRKYRVFQSSYQGPFHPGMEQYEMRRQGGYLIEGETQPRESLYASTLTANHDPGRGWKYLGSLMIVIGTLAFFYAKKNANARNSSRERQ